MEIGKFLLLDFTMASAGDLVAGFSFALMKNLFLYNAEDCMFWVFDSFTDFINAFLILTEENRPLQSMYSITFGMHKAPVAYNTCQILNSDFALVTRLYTVFFTQNPITWGAEIVLMFWNTFFNAVDIVYEALMLYEANDLREWTTIGEQFANIFSDIVFKSPITESWNYKNSDVLNEEWGEPLNLYDGMVNEINQVLEFYDVEPIPDQFTTIEKLFAYIEKETSTPNV